MTDALRGQTTILTEQRTSLVDRLGKKGVSRLAVSVRAPNVREQTVEVTQTQPHIIDMNTKGYLQIGTSFPVVAHFIPGVIGEEYPEPPSHTYTTGVIYAEPTLELNKLFTVSVYDPDVRADYVRITMFNATTGETEELRADKIAEGMFRAQILVEYKPMRGVDFDGVLNAGPDDVIRAIYRDGRGASGEPETIIHNVAVINTFVQPVLTVKRAVRANGVIGVRLNTTQLLPELVLRNTRTNERLIHHLIGGDGVFSAQLSVSSIADLLVGDVLEISHQYTNDFGVQEVVAATCSVVDGESVGLLNTPQEVVVGIPFLVEVDDPDLNMDYVDVILAGITVSDFRPVRLYRVSPETGVYRASTTIDGVYATQTAVSFTYTDVSNGAPKIIRKNVAVKLPELVEPPVIIPVDPEQPPVQFGMQLEINGLFTLNGTYYGIIKLYAKEPRTVRCSILQAS